MTWAPVSLLLGALLLRADRVKVWRMGCVMRSTGSEAMNKSLEIAIQEVSRTGVTSRQTENGDDELSANSLDTLLGRASDKVKARN